jgi:riboflavin kinase
MQDLKNLKPQLLLTLIYSVKLSREKLGSPVTTGMIAERLGVSQQTVSRHLVELERLGLISRAKILRGERIQATDRALAELRSLYHMIGGLLEPLEGDLILEGVVFTGLGEGAYYMSQPEYIRQFQERLGFKPYPGTLNLRLIGGSIPERRKLERLTPIIVDGFTGLDRSFGPVKCYRASLDGSEPCVVVTALRTHYGEDVLEVIAPQRLRERLGLKDGSTVTLRVFSTPRSPSS